MIYHLFDAFREWHIPGARLMDYISFRVVLSFILSLLISTLFGQKIINKLQKLQIGETVRNLGLEGQIQKKGTPTMGGIIIILAILIPTLLFCNLTNIYIILMIITTLLMGTLGFIDDYIKVFKKNKEGLSGKYKIVGQVLLGLIVASSLYFSPNAVIVQNIEAHNDNNQVEISFADKSEKSTATTIPFVKAHNLDYKSFFSFVDEPTQTILGWTLFFIVTVFIVTAVSNGVNLTDGIDGLASGTSAIAVVVLAIFAYVSSHIGFASYLNIMFIPGAGELAIFAGAFIGATIGFLWYNSFPAQVFMGDTGSLMLGGIIGVFAILIRKELLLPILCGIFMIETLSVLLQKYYFKITKKRSGVGRRIFKMAPLHHHFQKAYNSDINSIICRPKNAIHESKITIRFFLIALLLAALTIITLKIR